ncbi:GNAT family N-acetyltransferase [Amycolatopsis sp. PS_44_ISF1]|uniref:GNAT family N-acetyltransferase n=1 Tax=Amycolatopsis sp. PS_44_ISF1 TaxID=2974917 RepID=UPI0028DFD604|nr:GNAT family N-acetyltransferase [Amycolatopsis sp. PS_44_ISF1]MDT8910582.1 GNAT family N-acetyltransferase [Amycolatopsis sp. PS_44_ISF1]MDT8916339.1 GNAT family N-acetyltransferase [Amycolatopsis sp. PS_44_ISF1]MDT8916353.1 GNAT family N-acetyltransferase [Amycolatopsis sp. PS_44_ISF1]
MLIGELVRLRALEPSDAEPLYRWVNDWELGRWMNNSHPHSLDQIRKLCEDRKVNTYAQVVLGIERIADGRLLGVVDLRDAEPEQGRAEVDIYIGDREHQGGGYGTEALRLMCRYGFTVMRLHLIALWVVAENEAARHVYRKLGFVEDGRHRECFRGQDGRYHDMYLMSLLEGELT